MVASKLCFLSACSILLGSLLSVSVCQAETLLLNFCSVTCGPCQQMRPTIERLVADGYPVRHVDIGQEPEIKQRFRVDVVPTFIVVNDGREIARMTGPGSYEQLVEMLTAAQRSNSATTPVVPVSAQAPPSPQTVQNEFNQPVPNRILEIQDPNRPRVPIANTTTGQAATVEVSQDFSAKLLEATVKLSVEDADGVSAGTGTIIDAQGGAALILTCGHIFRTSQGKGPITVTMYSASPGGAQVRETVAGELLNYDLERDLALVVIRPTSPVEARRIASPNTPLSPGAPVITVGCNQGANPTAISSQITTVDRYKGAPNVEVAGAPIEGRSGGGLFNSDGQLIGVCFAADPQGNEGLYASLPSIQEKLRSLNLAMVYEASASPVNASGPQASLASITDREGLSVRGQNAAEELDAADPSFPGQAAQVQSTLNPQERAALAEIKRRGCDSEVICIVRPRDPNGKSEVITLGSVSPQFVEALTQQQGVSHTSSPATAAAGQLLR